MKKILLLLLLFSLSSCNFFGLMKTQEEVPNYKYTFEIEYINGTKDIKQFILPSQATFRISTNRGSYELEYLSDDQCAYCYGTLVPGALKYKLISKEPCKYVKP